ncbi:hypothetical protein R5R35_000601 [Gryllus longicercus]|uniref:5-formyltetrahydrofolate cyclo-ligase n=1 Tax=Gryllus longicercus TaxID=2509291 RepID=A0AAN9VBL3_9ORTH
MSATAAAKKALREEVRRAIAALSDAEKRRQSALVTEQVLARPEWAAARSVALFLSLRDEPCTRALLEAALASGRDVFAPRVLRADPPPPLMAMLRVRSAADAQRMPAGALGVREPPADADDALRSGGPDLVLVPGVAFAAAGGRRLGRGRGFYDEWLRECRAERARRGLPPPATLALAFRQQLFEHVPCEPHDAVVDAVIAAPDLP